MLKHPFVLALIILSSLLAPTLTPVAAQTVASTTLIYEYWPTQTGDGASLTATILNSISVDTLSMFTPRQNMEIHSVCFAIDTYESQEPGLSLGVYEVSDALRGTTLLGASSPLALNGQQISWHETGTSTCATFNNPVSLTKDKLYALGFDHTKTTKAEDAFMFFGAGVDDPDLRVAITNSVIGGTLILNNDKPYIRIYGRIVRHPVLLIPGILGSWEKNGTWVLDPLAHTYDNLVDTLKVNGFRQEWELFTLPYNWEQSNVVTAHELALKLAKIKEVCSCSKVDIVAHSMGGLVAMQYITSAEYAQDVGQLITLGTPFAGSPKAYKMWGGGEVDFGGADSNVVLNRIFAREAKDNGYDSVFAYLRGKPVASVQELLPVHSNYLLEQNDAHFINHPQNPFLTTLLMEDKVSLLKSSVSLHVVVGNTGTSTPTWYRVTNSTKLPLWPNGEILETILGQGDGTVPEYNAQYLAPAKTTLLGVAHRELPNASGAFVYKQLTGTDPAQIINKDFAPHDRDWSVLLQKIAPSKTEFKEFLETVREAFIQTLSSSAKHTVLFVTLYSPVDMQVTAPDGKRLGKDFATGNMLAEIPNARYSGPLEEHEYVVIEDPLPGTYKVETIGTGSGAYTVASGLVSNTVSTSSLVSGTTTLNQVILNTLFVSGTTTSLTLTPPPTPLATSTPTTTEPMLENCVQEITRAYQAKWIGKKLVYEKLVADCKILKELFKTREILEKTVKRASAQKTLLSATNTAIRLTIANMELLAKDKNNTKDAVLLITKITIWLKGH